MKTKLIVVLVIVLVIIIAVTAKWASMNKYTGMQPITNPALNNGGTSANLETLNPNGGTNGKGGTGTTNGNLNSGTNTTSQGTTTLPRITVTSDPSKSIAENAGHIGSTAIFTNALKTTGLTTTLQGTGPFTVFAPTDAAFQGLDKITSTHINATKTNLTNALTYHIVQGRYTAADLKDGMYLKTTEGQQLRITVNSSGQIFVNGAPVQTSDIVSSNGVMFIVGAVLIPAS